MRLPRAAPVFALLPGSRQSELKAHSSLLLRVAQQVHALLPEARFLVPLATRETREHFERAIATADAHALPVTVLFGHAQLALASADVALVASGTATLEAALMRCPMVITYRMPALSWRLMRRKALIPYVGLPNILAGEFIVPELLQDEATPENLSQAMLNWYRAREARELLEERMAALHALLRRDSPRRLAAAILPLLGATARAVPPGVQATGHADSPALSALRR
jgi:lipid-A-disaccharide synthase